MEEKRKQKAAQAEEQGISVSHVFAIYSFHVHVPPHCLLNNTGDMLHDILAEYSNEKCCCKISVA